MKDQKMDTQINGQVRIQIIEVATGEIKSEVTTDQFVVGAIIKDSTGKEGLFINKMGDEMQLYYMIQSIASQIISPMFELFKKAGKKITLPGKKKVVN